MRTPTKGMITMNMALSISYNMDSHITCAVLIGLSDAQQDLIHKQLKSASLTKIASHPLLLPSLLTLHNSYLLQEQIGALWNELVQAETASGRTAVPDPDAPPNPLIDIADAADSAITKMVLGISQLSILWTSETKELLQTIDLIRKSIGDVSKRNSGVDSQSGGPMICEVQQAAVGQLRELLSFTADRANSTLWNFEFLAQRAEAQTNAIYNFAAREIAVATKHDSAAMKAIAVMTILFLPGTFFATLFAMPLFDFSAPPGEPVLSSRLWIYWVFTGPFTVLLLLCYVGFTLVHDKLQRAEERVALGAGVLRAGRP
ncbi:hypothetical protein BR93DRAFT_972334 [Coniochaeta sp. PMI_546]|nr:hypothetical protein BR93DRAFT_972334 [Coniochaeta sp. PMI_546]